MFEKKNIEIIVDDFRNDENSFRKILKNEPIKHIYIAYDGGRFNVYVNGKNINDGVISQDFDVTIKRTTKIS